MDSTGPWDWPEVAVVGVCVGGEGSGVEGGGEEAGAEAVMRSANRQNWGKGGRWGAGYIKGGGGGVKRGQRELWLITPKREVVWQVTGDKEKSRTCFLDQTVLLREKGH